MEKVKSVDKVWGQEILMANTDQYCGKKLILRKGKRCSLHFHKLKDETFYIDCGRIAIEVDGTKQILSAGNSVRVVPGLLHRFSGIEESVLIETSTHHEDSDSYRVEGELSGDIPDDIKREYGMVI